jgi:uncharacterized peroxidase-related enzyme
LADQVAADYRRASLAPADRAMLEFAERLTHAPWNMGRANVEELRRHGFDDRDIHDIVQIAAYFNYINRVADGLGVAPEPFMQPWEHHGSENREPRTENRISRMEDRR